MLWFARVLFIVGGSILFLVLAQHVFFFGIARNEGLAYFSAAMTLGFAPLGTLAVLVGWALVGLSAKLKRDLPTRRDLVIGGVAAAPGIGLVLILVLPVLLA